MTTKVLICEDNLVQLEQIDNIIRNYIIFHDDQFTLGIPTQNPFDIIKYVQKFSVNGGIYFLDIDLKSSIDGIELAKEIKKMDTESRFIFITTHDEMAISVMQREIRAFNFILKDQPLDKFMDQVRNSLVEAQKDLNNSRENIKQSFSFNTGNITTNVDMKDIMYILTSEVPHQVDMYTTDGKYSFYANLNDIEQKYNNFFRAKRSCLANPQNIKHIDYSKHTLTFKNGLLMKFSIRRARELKNIIAKNN